MQDILGNIVEVVRASSALAAQDVDFYKSLDKSISESLTKTSNNVLELINNMLTTIDENTPILEYGKEKLEGNWRDFGDVMDNLLEKSDRSLDILSKRNIKGTKYDTTDGSRDADLAPFKKDNVMKPQLLFSTPVDNSESHPFKPLLKEKPNSLQALDECLKLVPGDENTPLHYPNPYEFEIDHQEYNENMLRIREPIPSQPWDSTTAIWVETKEALNDMIQDLQTVTEIAVDLEHHDLRSYYGITCLMQISTRSQDYIIDTIALRNDLITLNTIFTNPQITKVLHGAFMDIIWLQRDLGLYVVSLFDTFHASKALGKPRFSLSYLLENYAHFKTSKKYQLADWRIRPLPKEMNAYARSDTHFLLNIFDQMKNSLIEQDKLSFVLRESRNVAKRRFEYSKYKPKFPSPEVFSPVEKSDPWKSILFQYNIANEKEPLLRKLWEWRDMIARRDDESPRYVMANRVLVALASYTPTDANGVVSVSNIISDTVRSNASTIANLIQTCLNNLASEPQSVDSNKVVPEHNIILGETLTVPQLQNIVNKFKSLSSTLNKLSVQKDNVPSILFSEIMLGKNMFVNYNGSNRNIVDDDELLKRNDKLKSALTRINELQSVSYELDVEDSLPVETKSESHSSDVSEERPDAVKESQPKEEKEDLDEIIVLRDTKKRRHSGKQRENRNEKKEADFGTIVDYTKSEKIFTKDGKNNFKKSKKRSAFNPYKNDADSIDTPKGLKKRRPNSRGKNISFKH